MSDHNLAAQEDYRHTLNPGEHEAFHFLFTTPDGALFGYARLLFGHAEVLEMLALRLGADTWVAQQRVPVPPPPDIAGNFLRLACVQPWQHWHLHFTGQATAVETGETRALTFAAEFQATNPPTRYRFGPSYQQVMQDGEFHAHLTLDAQQWAGIWSGARDHTWGQRPMRAVRNCAVVTIPRRLYTVMVDTDMQPPCFGHWIDAKGQFTPVNAPQLTATTSGWTLEDVGGDVAVGDVAVASGVWTLRRLAEPLRTYYGIAGQEEVRTSARAGDLLQDEISPALCTAPDGENFIGFLDLLWGLHND